MMIYEDFSRKRRNERELTNITDFCVTLRRKIILNVSFDIKLTEYSLGNTQRLSIGYTVAMRD